jgi:AcrR family transcriptional regulator
LARGRKIEDDDVLDAAERVIARLGAAGLSIDAVAKEAGISKSRVVYDHKSKSALLDALIDRRLNAELERTRVAVAASRETSHPELFGRIAAAEQMPSHMDRAVMLAISAAVSSEEKLQNRIREWTADDVQAMRSDTDRPRAARMAYLALLGFCYTEYFDFYRWDETERRQLLDDIKLVFTSYREPE